MASNVVVLLFALASVGASLHLSPLDIFGIVIVFLFCAVFSHLASASLSPACGQWALNCTYDPGSGRYLKSTLSLTSYTYPSESQPPSYTGTFGSYTLFQRVYATSACSLKIGELWAYGEWMDMNEAQELEVLH